jgi:hypothetical protein
VQHSNNCKAGYHHTRYEITLEETISLDAEASTKKEENYRHYKIPACPFFNNKKLNFNTDRLSLENLVKKSFYLISTGNFKLYLKKMWTICLKIFFALIRVELKMLERNYGHQDKTPN